MDLSPYALGLLVQERLARARAEAAVYALITRQKVPTLRKRMRVRLGLALIGLGRWLRGPEPGTLDELTHA